MLRFSRYSIRKKRETFKSRSFFPKTVRMFESKKNQQQKIQSDLISINDCVFGKSSNIIMLIDNFLAIFIFSQLSGNTFAHIHIMSKKKWIEIIGSFLGGLKSKLHPLLWFDWKWIVNEMEQKRLQRKSTKHTAFRSLYQLLNTTCHDM